MTPRYPVVVFDLDGTLIRDTTTSLVMADALGHRPVVEELEELYGSYQISNHDFASREAALFTGLSRETIRRSLREAPWIAGLSETLKILTSHGCTLLLATLAWRFAVEEIEHRHWFAAVSGAEMDLEDNVLTGRVANHLDEEGKLDFVRQWCVSQGVPLSEVACIGDSRSDVPLFRVCGTAIALNATADAQAVATRAVDTNDLRDLLPFLL